MSYRHPDTGKFITREAWEALEEQRMDEFEDWADYDDFESLDEGEYI